MQMKKILGILLAVCFVMSVTAAAVSAGSGGDFNNRGNSTVENSNYNQRDNGNQVKHTDNNQVDNGVLLQKIILLPFQAITIAFCSIIDLFMSYKYPIYDFFHLFRKIARFFATEPYIEIIKSYEKEKNNKTDFENQ